MSTREALIREILKQPEPLLREVQHYLAFLVEHQQSKSNGAGASQSAAWPEGYFQRTAGAFAHEPFERIPELPFEQRQDW